MLQHRPGPNEGAVLFRNGIPKPLLNTWTKVLPLTTSQHDGPHRGQLGLDSHEGPPGNVEYFINGTERSRIAKNLSIILSTDKIE
jgi:hypothetical protein